MKHYGELFWKARAAMTERFIIFDKALWSISRQGMGGVSRNSINVNLRMTFLRRTNIEAKNGQIEANHHQE
jgi:hypothetical protein